MSEEPSLRNFNHQSRSCKSSDNKCITLCRLHTFLSCIHYYFFNNLFQFLIATITNHLKNNGLKNTNLKKIQIYYLTVLQVRGLNGFHWIKIKLSAGLHLILEALWEKLFPHLFQILETIHISQLMVPLLHLQSQKCSIILTLLLFSHLQLITDRKGSTLLTTVELDQAISDNSVQCLFFRVINLITSANVKMKIFILSM